MVKIRATKTTRGEDDFKVLMVGVICALMIMLGSLVIPRFNEMRWYRDLTRLTPFHEVHLLYAQVDDDKIEIMIGGTMVKRRCDFNTLFGYITGSDGIRYQVPVHTEAEPKGNRPPSKIAESWGPWILKLHDNAVIPITVVPESFEVIAEHVKCPSGPETQRNLFISGGWKDVGEVPFEEENQKLMKDEVQ